MDQKLVIHIGYPKCASTTLQKHFFSTHPHISFLGKYPTGNVGYDSNIYDPDFALPEKKIKKLHNLILNNDDFKLRKDKIKKEVYNILSNVSNEKVKLISNESFASTLFDKTPLERNADKIKELFPLAKILIITREPFRWLISQYRDQPFNPKNISQSSFVDFDTWVNNLFKHRNDILESLKFEKVYNYYKDLFGKSNIILLKMEDLNNEPKIFAFSLCDFLGIDKDIGYNCLKSKHENIGTSHGYTQYRRIIRKFKPILPDNSFIISVKIKLDTLVKKILPQSKRKVEYNKGTKKQIEDYFSDTYKFLEKQSF